MNTKFHSAIATIKSLLTSNKAYLAHVVKSMSGVHPRECPICNYSGKFKAFGSPPRWDAICKTADLEGNGVDLKLNIERIDLKDNSFDVVICCHVLEHVNHQLALAELFRILRPSGLLYLMVPIIEGWERTYENTDVKTDAGRNLHFGQRDHVRYFGSDLREMIKHAGFDLHEFTAEGENVIRYGLLRGEKVFVCSK